MAKQQKETVWTDYRENLRWGIIEINQTIGIVLISILLLSVTAIAAPANDDTIRIQQHMIQQR